ncbi:MAG TPA: helix-turn-helix domain-containing protein [Candidatus Angelobacter sp.]|jgi:DNA-binding NtrC family response regulator|nr:helix-turn-helix domain-containing protein [Candidatus Angelobacter sp.]
MESSQPSTKEQLAQVIAQSYSCGILYSEFVREAKKRFVAHVLRENRGNQSKAARELGMHRNTLSRTIAELRLSPAEWDPNRQLAGRFPSTRSATTPAGRQRALGA